jgi:hypothetical protein
LNWLRRQHPVEMIAQESDLVGRSTSHVQLSGLISDMAHLWLDGRLTPAEKAGQDENQTATE